MLGYSGWQDYDISSGDDLVNLAIIRKIHRGRWVCWGCQVYRLYGAAGYRSAQRGRNIGVAAATGPVGATVGQIGKLKGAGWWGWPVAWKNAAMLLRCWLRCLS